MFNQGLTMNDNGTREYEGIVLNKRRLYNNGDTLEICVAPDIFDKFEEWDKIIILIKDKQK